MFLNRGHLVIIAGATASLLVAAGTDAARAADPRPAVLAVAPAYGEWQAIDHCAAYGPDFTSVAGSDACVRIGGRVRVEYHFRGQAYETDSGWATSHSATIRSDGTTAPLDDVLDGMEQGHLRVHSVGASADPFH